MIEREVAAWLLNVFSVHKLAPQTMYVRKEFFRQSTIWTAIVCHSHRKMG